MGSPLQDLKPRPSRRILLDVVLVLLLWPVLMIFPSAPETYLDASWQETLVYAHAQGWQFGRDLIFTWGPWGFLNSIFHFGDAAAVTRLGWELGGKLLLVVGLLAGTRRLSPGRQAVFAVVCALCLPVFQDAAYLLFITVAVLAGLLRPGAQRGVMLAIVVALAFLAQIKFTYALLVGAGVGLAGVVHLSRRQWLAAGLLGGGFLLAYLGWWLAAGQNPDNIVPYLRRSWEVSTGYAEAMSADESLAVFLCGLAVLAFHGAFVWQIWRRQTDRALAAGTVLFLLAVWFLAWKHGFTRADGHVMGFFFYALPVALVLPVLCFPEVPRWSWLDLAVLPCLAGLWFFEPGLPLKLPASALSRLQVNIPAAWHITTLPAAWRAELERARTANALPTIRRAVGAASVDVFNYEQGVALLNGLNFSPRPVFQGYSAYTSRLAGRNLHHYQSAAPDYVLWHHSSIDDRFPTLDDAPLVAELARAYRPVLTEDDFLLLQRTAPFPAAPLARELLQRQTVALGESLAVPAVSDCALWVQIFPDATQLGRLRALLYKPAMLNLTVEEVTGRQTTWRLLPRIAEDGFLLQPFLETQSDFGAYLRGRGRKQIRSLRIDASAGDGEFWKGAEVRFLALRGLPIENEAAYLELVEAGVTNLAPGKVAAPAPLEIFSLGTDKAALLHAPARMEFTLPAGTARLTASFGLRPGAYDQGGHTEGVEFRVTATWLDGRTETLWRRWLDPVHHSVDRGVQSMEITLPASRPATVILQTGPGPTGNTQWAWSYWTQIKFSPAPVP